MKKRINNIDELKWEIARLTELKREQESYLNNQYTLLRSKVDAPMRIFSSLSSTIPGMNLLKGVLSTSTNVKNVDFKEGNYFMNLIRIGLPIVLNKTFLKKSSWLKKSLVLLLSDTVAKQVTQDNVSAVISKISDFIRPKNNKKRVRKAKMADNPTAENNMNDPLEDQILGI